MQDGTRAGMRKAVLLLMRRGQRLWRDGKEVTLSHNSSPPTTRAGGQGHSRPEAVFKQAKWAADVSVLLPYPY